MHECHMCAHDAADCTAAAACAWSMHGVERACGADAVMHGASPRASHGASRTHRIINIMTHEDHDPDP